MINNIKTVNEDQGQTVSVVGDNYRIIIPGTQTQGAYAVIDMLVPGVFLPPPAFTPEDLQRLRSAAEKHGQKLYPPDYLG